MGCIHSNSSNAPNKPPVHVPPTKEERDAKKRRSTVHIRMGQSVKSNTSDKNIRNILFFGGPKSGKGQVIEELVESFSVKVISAESLIVSCLPRKLTKENGSGKIDTATMMHMLKSQPDLVSLDWIFELVKSEVLKSPDAVHVIDLLPNSKIILRNQKLFENAGELLEKFEEICPVAFAMHLYIDKENLNKQLDSAAHLSTPEGCTAPGGINDEADSAATKRRHAYFEEALKPVKNYFKQSDRLIEVDVSSMSHERIWYKVVGMFASFDLSTRQNNNLIIIFTTDADSVQGLVDNQVRLIRVAEIVDEPDSDFELLLECLLYQINELGCPNICYIVDIKDSSLQHADKYKPQRSLIYELLDDSSKLSSFLNKYQLNMLSNSLGKWDDNIYYGYKAPNNLTLLFSPLIEKRAAEIISTTYCSMDK